MKNTNNTFSGCNSDLKRVNVCLTLSAVACKPSADFSERTLKWLDPKPNLAFRIEVSSVVQLSNWLAYAASPPAPFMTTQYLFGSTGALRLGVGGVVGRVGFWAQTRLAKLRSAKKTVRMFAIPCIKSGTQSKFDNYLSSGQPFTFAQKPFSA